MVREVIFVWLASIESVSMKQLIKGTWFIIKQASNLSTRGCTMHYTVAMLVVLEYRAANINPTIVM